MEIVCEKCSERGEPAAVRALDGGVALECAACGHLNQVGGPAASEEAEDAGLANADPPAEGSEGPLEASREEGREPQEEDREPQKKDRKPQEETVAAEPLVAPEVPPMQCRKCGHRQASGTDSCRRCGFVFALDEPGEMSWDRLAKLPEAQEAEELWQEALEHGTASAHERFMEFCQREDLLEFAGRKYRFRRADRPDDVHAQRQLEQMVQKGRTALSSRLEEAQQSIRGDAASVQRKILLWVFIVGVALALLFLSLYPSLF